MIELMLVKWLKIYNTNNKSTKRSRNEGRSTILDENTDMFVVSESFTEENDLLKEVNKHRIKWIDIPIDNSTRLSEVTV